MFRISPLKSEKKTPVEMIKIHLDIVCMGVLRNTNTQKDDLNLMKFQK